MKIPIVIALLFLLTGLKAQVQFSIVCNQNNDQLEVVVKGQEKPFQKVLKSNFPNQRVAAKYLDENKSSMNCGPKPKKAIPPPTTAGRKKKNSTNISSTPRKGQVHYPRNFLIKIRGSKMLAFKELYPGNGDIGMQDLGFSFGGELFYGKKVKGGIGMSYSSVFGTFEKALLNEYFDVQDFYGSLHAYRGAFVIKSPIRVAKDNWIVVNFDMALYFNILTSLEEGFAEYVYPELAKNFFGFRWGLAMDIKGLNVMVDFELTSPISEDIEKENFILIGLGLGYAF